MHRGVRQAVWHVSRIVIQVPENIQKSMKLTKNQLQFIINCDVEQLVAYLQEDYQLPLVDAFDKVYNSHT